MEWMSFGACAEAKDMKSVSTWPVGQVVKTAASHAVNIGSNPVRVTSQKEADFLGESEERLFENQMMLDKRSGVWYNTKCSRRKPKTGI